MLRSFRMRLVVAFVALFAAMSVAVSFAGLMVREQQIRNVFDKELLTRATDLNATVARQPILDDKAMQQVVTDLTSQIYFRDFYVQAWDDRGATVAKSINLREVSLPAPLDAKSVDNDGAIFNIAAPNGLSLGNRTPYLRAIRVHFSGGGGRSYLVAVMTNPMFIADSVNSLRWLFLAGNLGGLVAASGAAWLVTGAISRRIAGITQQVQRVGPEDLDRRIDTRDNDEISQLAVHLNAMLDRLKAGFETQERFIHDASHELKTPVATVQAEAQAILLGEPTQDELTNFVHATNDEMRRLGRLAESLLLLTRNRDPGSLRRFHPVELSEVATSALRHLSALATDHQVQLQLQDDGKLDSPVIECDADLLESMISNLVRNAIRFSPRNHPVNITLQRDEHHARVIVEDEGPGIPQDVLPHIFDRFFQTSANRVRRGAGVGLAIASTVAHLHGGKISVANRPNRGARFLVELPISPAPHLVDAK